MSKILLENVNETKETKLIDISGLFIAIGHDPNTKIFKNQIELDESNYIVLDKDNIHFATQTSIEGIFAAGDVADPTYRQAVTSAGSGCMAALDVEKYLDNL